MNGDLGIRKSGEFITPCYKVLASCSAIWIANQGKDFQCRDVSQALESTDLESMRHGPISLSIKIVVIALDHE